MSEENVALVRRTYEVINSIGRTGSDFVDPEDLAPDLWERLGSEFELHERPDLPDRKTYRGREESKKFWRKTQELFAELHWEPREFIDLGHAVVVETRIVARGRGSDVRVEADETDVFWFRDGAIVRLQGFPSKADALEAAARVE
jgi:ketosteroid isomerase-like protein